MNIDDFAKAFEFYDWKEDREIIKTETMEEAVEDWVDIGMKGTQK